jgi:hypothetical protein
MTSCDQGIEPTVVELTYRGTHDEGDPFPSFAFRVYEFTDDGGNLYRYTLKGTRIDTTFSCILTNLKVGDRIQVRARFGCCSWAYRKSTHHANDGWLGEAIHFVRPRVIAAPRVRAKKMPSYVLNSVPVWRAREAR